MEYFISNLENSLTVDIPLLSLAGSFILIDSMSALDSEEGTASEDKFKKWIEKYLPDYLRKPISAKDYYTFRCALLHQLSGSREDMEIKTFLFFPKNSCIQGHLNYFNKAFNFDIPTFVKDVTQATRKCIEKSTYYKKK